MIESRRMPGTLLASAIAVLVGFLIVIPMAQRGARTRMTRSDLAYVSASRGPDTTTDRPVTSATTTATTIPEIEALIPLSAETLVDDVAQAVGFVLTEQGTGSGVVISDELLVTNAHVVWPDRTVTIVFQNGAIHQGRVLALDPFVDLAVVDISKLARRPVPITIGSIEDVVDGDDLYVLGYPAPDEFTPIPTVDVGEVLGLVDWEFTGMRWLTIQAPAIGGQSGGAVVDQYGRLIGISTFGSTTSLTSISIDDVLAGVDELIGGDPVRGLEPRVLPHGGARRTNPVTLEGPWDQQLLLGWFLPDAEVRVSWADGAGYLGAGSIGDRAITSGMGSIEFTPDLSFPVVVQAESATAVSSEVESSLPLIAYEDPDHGRELPYPGMAAGVYEVGGDRDFFYLTIDKGETLQVTVESAARTHLVVYGPDGTEIAEDTDVAGFVGSNAEVEFTAATSGRHVVSLESSRSTISGYMVITRS